MASGIHSTIRSLKTRLALRWVPKWHEAFSEPNGGFFERLGKGFKPVSTGQRRLVTQCRQLSIYSHYSYSCNKNFATHLKDKFEFILIRYHDPATNLWHFSLDDAGNVKDKICDLYALSFAIFSFAHYFKATGDDRAKKTALGVLTLIDANFRFQDAPGFAEALDERGQPRPAVRRQNPHMHLLEACLFAKEIFGDASYERMADEIVALFQNYFFKDALVEFFTHDLHPDPEKGDHLEPGHYFEWVWLLKKHAALKNDPALHNPLCQKLLNWANRNGWDSMYGGIYDTVSSGGRVLADTKRIWPFCEALKANALMLNAAQDRQEIKDRMTDMATVFRDKYISERGFWVEWLNRDLTPAADYMPGTTPYHVYFGIMETWDVISARGESVSLVASLEEALYGLRRSVSNAVKALRV